LLADPAATTVAAMYDTDKIETVMRYRERTKHVVDRYAFGRVELDWANQPNPFRSYAGAPARVLAAARCPLSAARSFARMGGTVPFGTRSWRTASSWRCWIGC